MRQLILALAIVLTALSGGAQAQTPRSGSTLLSFDFNGDTAWPKAFAAARGAEARVSSAPVGTIDEAGTARTSGAVALTVEGAAGRQWTAALLSGPLALRNSETNAGKLTLSFSLAASKALPVVVRIESADANRKRTGGLETRIYPAAPDFYQRYALDLSTMKAVSGAFKAGDPFVQISFEIGGADGWPSGKHELRVDNVHFAAPAYYVSPGGSDRNDGRTEKTALATPQKALDAALPGDIVLLMGGVYRGGAGSVASFRRAGTPAAWITLKNYPGQKPTLTSTGWNIVSIAQGSKATPSDAPALAYLEIRGLHIRGEGDVAREKHADALNKPDSRTNSNGIAVEGRFMKNIPHHIRMADNLVEYCPGQGLGAIEADYITIENNVSRYNCWTTIYGTSGISTLGASNYDAADNVYKILIRNNISCRNETYNAWGEIGKISDGNGIIIDVNQKTATHPDGSYIGRTLVQNNLCFDNGGSGIHTVRANRVDIIHNTTCFNSASESLEYSQIYTYASDDVRIANNILVAPVADIAKGAKPEPVNQIKGKNGTVVFTNNLYWGGNIDPFLGEGDRIGDPQFVNASRDPRVADFHLKAGSPAIGAGRTEPFSPFLDLDGKPRGSAPCAGAYEKVP